jgi:hypothetical protein
MKPADETALIGNENPGAQEADSRVDSTRTTAEQSTGAGSPPTARESLGERLRSEEEARIIGSLEPEHRARRLPSPAWWNRMLSRLAQANKELWLILSMLLIAGVANYLVTSGRMVLGFYTLPTLFSAYFYGRRHAVLSSIPLPNGVFCEKVECEYPACLSRRPFHKKHTQDRVGEVKIGSSSIRHQ